MSLESLLISRVMKYVPVDTNRLQCFCEEEITSIKKGEILKRASAVVVGVGLLIVLGVSLAPVTATRGQSSDVPTGVDILLPRGGIPAVFDPQFVSADEADISDDAWVLGVVIDGEARAYSLNLLNHHEIVNDYFGERPVAAVW